jgi:AGZA family xanthine/uracil permease-like MFS transporter
MLDTFFKISQRGSSVAQEVRGGVVTFFTMAYIVALNPLIIGLTKDADGKYIGGGDAPNLALIAAATALVAGVLSILMGVIANFPLALATGLGLNTFVAVEPQPVQSQSLSVMVESSLAGQLWSLLSDYFSP